MVGICPAYTKFEKVDIYQVYTSQKCRYWFNLHLIEKGRYYCQKRYMLGLYLSLQPSIQNVASFFYKGY